MYLYGNFIFSNIHDLISLPGPDKERVYRAREKANFCLMKQ